MLWSSVSPRGYLRESQIQFGQPEFNLLSSPRALLPKRKPLLLLNAPLRCQQSLQSYLLTISPLHFTLVNWVPPSHLPSIPIHPVLFSIVLCGHQLIYLNFGNSLSTSKIIICSIYFCIPRMPEYWLACRRHSRYWFLKQINKKSLLILSYPLQFFSQQSLQCVL